MGVKIPSEMAQRLNPMAYYVAVVRHNGWALCSNTGSDNSTRERGGTTQDKNAPSLLLLDDRLNILNSLLMKGRGLPDLSDERLLVRGERLFVTGTYSKTKKWRGN